MKEMIYPTEKNTYIHRYIYTYVYKHTYTDRQTDRQVHTTEEEIKQYTTVLRAYMP